MKLINYYRGMTADFDCVIHGTIKMSPAEFQAAADYLLRAVRVHSDSFWTNILKEDLARRIPVKKGFLVNVRVTPTELLAKRYGLDNYKRGNYQILVT